MAVTGPSRTIGVQTSGSWEDHLARSAARRLVAALFDAWDGGDARSFVGLFAPDGRWTGPSGRVAGDLVRQFRRWRAWEPWSLHWLSNEEVLVVDGELRGTWLWSSASTIEGGRVAAWSGGDLSLVAAPDATGDRWSITELAMTDRYRTPYRDGWLAVPQLAVELGPDPDGEGAGPVGVADVPGTSVGPAAGDAPALLSAEVELRATMGDLIDDQEEGRDPLAIASRWTDRGTFERVERGRTASATGRPAIARAWADEAASMSAIMRVLCSESIEVTGDRAVCSWRDLWTAVEGGSARWVAHRYGVDAVRDEGQWRFARMTRHRLLDCPYDRGWTATPFTDLRAIGA